MLINSTNSQSTSAVRNFPTNINGAASILNSNPIDICKYVPKVNVSCPTSIKIDENYNQNLAVSITPNTSILEPGQSLSVSFDIEGSNPNLNLQPTITFDGKSSSVKIPYPLSLQSPGSNPIITVPIVSLTPYLEDVGLPTEIGNYVDIGLNGNLNSNFFLNGKISDSFSGPNITWSNSGAKKIKLNFSDYPEGTASLTLSLNEVQNIQPSITLNLPLYAVPLINGPTLVNYTLSKNNLIVLNWYRVVIEQPTGGSITPNFGTRWYENDYTINFNATVNPGYEFMGYYSYGTLLSNSLNFSYTVTQPTDINPVFKSINGGLTIPSWVWAIIIIIIILLVLWFMRRNNRRYRAR